MSKGGILFFILMGGLFFVNYLNTGQVNREIETWPKTKAKILKTEFVRTGSPGGPGLLVEYEFYANGNRYQSDYVYPNHRHFTAVTPAVVHSLEFIKNPEVKYNPLKPDHSCLLPYPSNWVVTSLLVFGIMLSLVGWLGLLLRFFKKPNGEYSLAF